MIMSLSPYSNSPVTASFVSVTSTAKGLSKSTFQKMKRECFPDDKPNFSIDKRVRFFYQICQCCVAFISSNVPVFSFFNIHGNLDVSVTGKNEMMKHYFGSREAKSIRLPQREKGERKKKTDAFSKTLTIGKKSKRVNFITSRLRNFQILRLYSLRPITSL